MIDRVISNRRVAAVGVIVIVLVVVAIMFFMQWQTAKDEKDNVETQKNAAELRLKNAIVEYDIDELRRQKENLSGSAKFPEKFPAVEFAIFLADASWNTVDIEIQKETKKVGTEYITEDIKVTGSLSKIISFLKYIESGNHSSIKDSIKVQAVVFEGTEAWGTATFDVVLNTLS